MEVNEATLSSQELNRIIEALEARAADTRIDREIREREGFQTLADNLKRLRVQQASGYSIKAIVS